MLRSVVVFELRVWDASERVVPMVSALHEILLAARAEQPSGSGLAFATRRGTGRARTNVRARLLAAVRERADDCSISGVSVRSRT